MKALLIILLVGGVSYQLSDADSGQLLTGFLFPFLCGGSVVAGVIWLFCHLDYRGGSGGGGGTGSGGFGGFGDGGGGCGGGDGGGGC
ncbi:hypothetical protein [Marinobacter xestospongiae]|uniref:Uncharacterized protein n=1 Tax=Marinobacter xestospongiae TaxID=994319 RepID=A0ABU3VUV4_9GAMM|nr:hypothetical protein [Marinobacter xestospongiae]MDV2078053.1 hypothetical protein [Marinobacter xestospongiae]